MDIPDDLIDERLSSIKELAPKLHRKLFKLCLGLDTEKYPEAAIILKDKHATLAHLGKLKIRIKKEKKAGKNLKEAEELISAISAALGHGDLGRSQVEPARRAPPPGFHKRGQDALTDAHGKVAERPTELGLSMDARAAETRGDKLEAARAYSRLVDLAIETGSDKLRNYLLCAKYNYREACTETTSTPIFHEAIDFLTRRMRVCDTAGVEVRRDLSDLYQIIADRMENPVDAIECAFKAWEVRGFELSIRVIPMDGSEEIRQTSCTFTDFISGRFVEAIRGIPESERWKALGQICVYCKSGKFKGMMRDAGKSSDRVQEQVARVYKEIAELLGPDYPVKELFLLVGRNAEATNPMLARTGYACAAEHEVDPIEREKLMFRGIWIFHRTGFASDQQEFGESCELAARSTEAQIKMAEHALRGAFSDSEIRDGMFLFFRAARKLPDESEELAIATRRILFALGEASGITIRNTYILDGDKSQIIRKCQIALAKHRVTHQGPLERDHARVWSVASRAIAAEFENSGLDPRWSELQPLIERTKPEKDSQESGCHFTHTNKIRLADDYQEKEALAVHEGIHFLVSLQGGFMKTFESNGQTYLILDDRLMDEGLVEYFNRDACTKQKFQNSGRLYPIEVSFISELAQHTSNSTLRQALVTGDFTEVCKDVDASLGGGAFLQIASAREVMFARRILDDTVARIES